MVKLAQHKIKIKYIIFSFIAILIFISIVYPLHTNNHPRIFIRDKNSKMTGIKRKKESERFVNNSVKDLYRVISLLKTKNYYHNPNDLRKFPEPYNAMFSICSDIDSTTLKEFETYHQFLNTTDTTPFGKGLGLDIGDSFWVFTASPKDDSLSMFNGTNIKSIKYAAKIKYYFDKGWIDSIHTIGNFSRYKKVKLVVPDRKLILKGWNALNSFGIHPIIWINHGDDSNIQNYGGYSPKSVTKTQDGDKKGSECYHTDITYKNGIRYLWNSNITYEYGYDNPLYIVKLRDKQIVWAFKRCSTKLTGKKVTFIWSPQGIREEITKQRLENIIKKNQYSIIANHFGSYYNYFPFGKEDIKALRLLKQYQDNGKVLVARTSRLLKYVTAQNYVIYTKIKYNGLTYIDIKSINDPLIGKIIPSIDNLRGITFFTDNSIKTRIMINYKLVGIDNLNFGEFTKQSIGIKWFRS